MSPQLIKPKKKEQNSYLITLYFPDVQNFGFAEHRFKLASSIEDGTAIWSIIAIYIKTRRVGLRKEKSWITLCIQNPLQKVIVIYLLKKANETVKIYIIAILWR